LQKRFGTKDSIRCSEFGGGRFSGVANVLQVWDFQSVTRALSAQGVCPLLGVLPRYPWHSACRRMQTIGI